MSYRYEFVAEARDGHIELPDEIAARLRIKGVSRLRVVITSMAEEEEMLARRGIDADTIDRVAGAQRFDRDVATVALGAEGRVPAGSALATRLRATLTGTPAGEPAGELTEEPGARGPNATPPAAAGGTATEGR